MTILETVVVLVVDVTIGVWLGGMVFFSLVGTPATVDVLGDDAEDVVTTLFSRYHILGSVLGFTAINIVVVAQSEAMLDSASSLFISPLLLVALCVTIYAQIVLVPKMRRADAGFFEYHRQSILLNGVSMLSLVGGLVCSHF